MLRLSPLGAAVRGDGGKPTRRGLPPDGVLGIGLARARRRFRGMMAATGERRRLACGTFIPRPTRARRGGRRGSRMYARSASVLLSRPPIAFDGAQKGRKPERASSPRALTKPTTAKIALIYKKSEAIFASGGGFVEPFGIVKSSRHWRQILPPAKFPRQLHLHPCGHLRLSKLPWLQVQLPWLAGFLNALPVCPLCQHPGGRKPEWASSPMFLSTPRGCRYPDSASCRCRRGSACR